MKDKKEYAPFKIVYIDRKRDSSDYVLDLIKVSGEYNPEFFPIFNICGGNIPKLEISEGLRLIVDAPNDKLSEMLRRLREENIIQLRFVEGTEQWPQNEGSFNLSGVLAKVRFPK